MLPQTYCRRCDDLVRTIDPWPHWRLVFRVWVAGLLVLGMVLPFFMWDMCFVQPFAMLYFVCGSILWHESRRKSVCKLCSLELDRRDRGGTGIRRRPAA